MTTWFLVVLVVTAASLVTVPLAVTVDLVRARRYRAARAAPPHRGAQPAQTSWPVIIGLVVALIGAVPAAGLVARSTWLVDRLSFAGCDPGESIGRIEVAITRGSDIGLVCRRPDGGSKPTRRTLYVAGGLLGASVPLALGALATWVLLLRRRARLA